MSGQPLSLVHGGQLSGSEIAALAAWVKEATQ